MGKKFAGLPLWAWVGIAVVGYYVWTRYRAASQSAQQTTAEQQVLANAWGNITGSPYAAGYGGASSPGQGAAGTSPGSGSGAPGTTTTTPTPTATSGGLAVPTNQQAQLVAQGSLPYDPNTLVVTGSATNTVASPYGVAGAASPAAQAAAGVPKASGTTPWGSWTA
jgi:hypothetical protein